MKWGTWYLVSEPRSLQAWCCVLEEPDGNTLPSCTTQLCWKAKLKRAKRHNNKTHPLGSLWFQGQQHRNLFYSTHIGLPVSHTEHTMSGRQTVKSLCACCESLWTFLPVWVTFYCIRCSKMLIGFSSHSIIVKLTVIHLHGKTSWDFTHFFQEQSHHNINTSSTKGGLTSLKGQFPQMANNIISCSLIEVQYLSI